VNMNRFRSLSYAMGLIIVLCYGIAALLAALRYPLHYSPLTNWLSDLGNPAVNSSGALFYNTGIVLTGVLLLPFFLGLSVLKLPDNRPQNLMLVLTQAFGLFGAFSMIMTALYPINFSGPHSFWSAGLRIGLGTAFGFSVAALRYYPGCPRWVLALGVVTTLVDLLVSQFFNKVQVLEWPTIALFLAYLVVLGVETKRLSTEAVPGMANSGPQAGRS